MSEIQVEVCFTDKLKSVRVGGKEMEIPKAVKAKPVEEWFEPAAGRVKWGGLGAEIKEMDISGEKNALLVMGKEGIKNMPVMSLETYLDRVKGGEDEKAVLIDIAVDYARMVSIQRRSQHRQMAR